jgi:betaine-homocysteine S-methyltransferase
MSPAANGLRDRLDAGPVVCAEGYLFELERRGYVQAGAFVPEVVLDHPEVVTELHREFVHAGSDVVPAFTYYAHREKMRVVGKEHLLEELNRTALALATEVAAESGGLAAGDICNTNVFSDDPASRDAARAMFEEQVAWAAEAGVDFVIAETISYAEEALAALKAITDAGLPAVVTLAVHQHPVTREGWTLADTARRLEDAGADVVGLNCMRGPATMLPLLEEIRGAVSCHVAALPVPYRTHETEPTFQSLRDPASPDQMAFPTALEPFTCTRYEIANFARAAHEAGVGYLGLCCGGAPHHIRSLAEALGRTPPASRYTEDMSKHAYFGTDESVKEENVAYAREL